MEQPITLSPPIRLIEQSAAYIEGKRKRLASDEKLVVHAAGAGQKATDGILSPKIGHRLPISLAIRLAPSTLSRDHRLLPAWSQIHQKPIHAALA